MVFIGMVIAALVVGGMIVFHVGRFIFDAVRGLRSSRRLRLWMDPELGMFRSTGGELWEIAVKQGDREIACTVAGTVVRPEARAIARLQRVLTDFAGLEAAGLGFLRAAASKENMGAPVGAGAFSFYQLEVLGSESLPESPPESPAQSPYTFVMEFVLEGDVDGVWRVEFEDGQPRRASRDD